MILKPMHDWAVIRPSEAMERTAGGLYIPETAKEKPREGIVVAIGPGALEEEKFGKKKVEKKDRRFIPTIVKPGDRVLYEQYADRTYKVGHDELVLVRERDLLGTLTGEAAKPRELPSFTSSAGSTALVPAASVRTKPVAAKTPAKKAAPAGKTTKKPAAKKKTKNK